MSMLAGPRRKQRVVNLRAGDSAWSKDPDKFGQKLLERWGWAAGRGLGAREDGVQKHVVARYKNDECGLGYEERTDQWTQHEDQFSRLLADLSAGSTNEDKLHSGVSLEGKSKKSKARVHYHKFTRGKDISRYSDKDLANIFGKKSLTAQVTDKLDENSNDSGNEDEPVLKAQVFKEGGNMDDYFKNKLKLLGKALASVERNKDDVDYSFKGFSGSIQTEENESKETQGFELESFSFYSKNNNDDSKKIDESIVNGISEGKENLNKKKRKKNKNVTEFSEENTVSPEILTDAPELEVVNINSEGTESLVKKKRKKNKVVAEISVNTVSTKVEVLAEFPELEVVNSISEGKGKSNHEKQKKKKVHEIKSKMSDEISENEIVAPKKKKVKKTVINCGAMDDNLPESDEIATELNKLQASSTRKSKKNKNKSVSTAKEESSTQDIFCGEKNVTSKKKKSKRKLLESSIQMTIQEPEEDSQQSEQPTKKKKKKDKYKHL